MHRIVYGTCFVQSVLLLPTTEDDGCWQSSARMHNIVDTKGFSAVRHWNFEQEAQDILSGSEWWWLNINSKVSTVTLTIAC